MNITEKQLSDARLANSTLRVVLQRTIGERDKAEMRVCDLDRALRVAIVTMASVWPEDFLAAFGKDKLSEIVDSQKVTEDFKVEDMMVDVLCNPEWETR